MSTSRVVARGTTRLLAGLLTAKGLDFVFYLVLARVLGVEQFGRYSYALSFTLLFSILADLGVLTIFTREASRAPHRTPELLREVLIVKLGLGLATITASSGITIATHAPTSTLILVVVFTISMLLNSCAMLFENLLKSAGRAGVAGVSVLAQSATALATGLTLVLSGGGAIAGAIAYLLAAVVHLVAAAVWSRKLWRRGPAGESGDAAGAGDLSGAPTTPQPLTWGSRLALLKESAPRALSGACIGVYFRIDSVMLPACHGASAVGLYGGTYRFFEGFVLFSAAYRSVLFPIMARAADGPAETLGVLCRKSLRLHLMFTIGVAVFFTLQASEIIGVVLGPAYAAAGPALAILVWALPGAFMADTLYHLLAAQRRQTAGARALAITAAFNVALNLTLIPRMSIVGAAITAVASQAMSFGLMYGTFRTAVPRIGLVGVARAPIVAGTIAALALMFLSPLDPGGVPGLALMAMFAISSYVLALVALGAVGRQDAELVQEVLPSALRVKRPAERRGSGGEP